MSSIPLSDAKDFDAWLVDRWREKDELLEQWYDSGRFPGDTASASPENGISEEGYIDTEMTLNSWAELGQIFVVPAAAALVVNVVLKFVGLFARVR